MTMTQKVKKKFPLFAVILISCLLALSIVIFFVLKLLWTVLDEYESTMPEYAVAEIGELFTEKNYARISELAGIKAGSFDSEDDVEKYLDKLFSAGDIKWGKKAGSGNANCYVVAAGKTKIGEIYLKEMPEKTEHGFVNYEFDRLSVPFEPAESVEITVPHGYTVYVNGIQVGSEYIAETNIKVDALKNIESDIPIPYLDRYKVTGLISPAGEVKVISADGSDAPLTGGDSSYTAGFCGDSALQEEIYPVVEDFAKRYSEYLTSDGSFRSVAKYIIHPSKLYTNLSAMETYFYTNHDSYKFKNMAPYGFVRYSDKLCAAGISFDHYLYRSGGTKEYHYKSDFTVFFILTDKGWLVDSMQMNYSDREQ